MTQTAAAIVWALGIVAWALIRQPYRRRARRTEVATDRKSTSEKMALGLCIAGLVVIPALQLTTGIFDFANYPYQPVMGVLGTLTMIAFLVMFYLSHKHLANNWSVSLEIRKDHKLVDSGVYRHIRHPMYASFFLWGLAQFLLIPNWIAGTSGLASVAWLYFSRIENEEDMMRERFGKAYEEYGKKTARLIPKIY